MSLSYIQFETAEEHGDKFWLYVVENVFDEETVTIYTIQNPFGKVTQYQFDYGWKKTAEDVQTFEIVEPRYGDYIIDERGHKAKIEKTSFRGGNRLVLTVKYENGHAGRIDYEVTKHQVVKQ